MKRKEDRIDKIVYKIRQVIKRRKIFGRPPLVASDCTRWEEVWLVGDVGDVVSFVIQMRIPLPSRQLLHHAGSRVTRLGWAGLAGLAGLGY